jgi:hypothetical protein
MRHLNGLLLLSFAAAGLAQSVGTSPQPQKAAPAQVQAEVLARTLPGVSADGASGMKIAGGVAANTLSASNLPITVTAPPYSAIPDCATDNTNALQLAINAAAATGQDVYIPQSPFGSCYKFKSLYFYYDKALNPGFPTNGSGHSFRFRGAGATTVGPRSASFQRTMLISTTSDTPALNLGDGSSFLFNNDEISDLTIHASSSSWIIYGNLIPVNSSFRNLSLGQFGPGGGLYLHNVWSNTLIQDVTVVQEGTSITPGSAGVKICNDIDAGLVTLSRVAANGTTSGGGWDHGFELGSVKGVDDCGRQIAPMTLVNVDAERDNTGIFIGRGPEGSLRDFYTENNHTQGIYLGNNNQRPWTIELGYMYDPAASAAGIYIDGPNAGRGFPLHNVSISGVFLNHVNRYGIYINDENQLTSGVIRRNTISTTVSSAVAIGFPPVPQNWTLDNNQMLGFAEPVPNLRYVAESHANGALTVSRMLTAAGLSVVSPSAVGPAFSAEILPPENTSQDTRLVLPAASGTVGVVPNHSSGHAMCETPASTLGHCYSAITSSGTCDCR